MFVVVSFVFSIYIYSVLLSLVADVVYPKYPGMHFLHFLIYAIKLECIAHSKTLCKHQMKMVTIIIYIARALTHTHMHTIRAAQTQIKTKCPKFKAPIWIYAIPWVSREVFGVKANAIQNYIVCVCVSVTHCVLCLLHIRRNTLLSNKNVKSKW